MFLALSLSNSKITNLCQTKKTNGQLFSGKAQFHVEEYVFQSKISPIRQNLLLLCTQSRFITQQYRFMVKKEMSKDEALELISDLWNPLNDIQREHLSENLTIHTFKKNEPIYSEGEFPNWLMCLLSGKVKIFKEGVGGRNQIIRVIKPVEYFAYRAYFARQEYLTAAAAFETSTICMIPMATISDLIRENNELAQFFIRQLSIDLGIADERTVNLTQKHIRGRLAESILFLKESYGLEEDHCTLSIYLSREDLANLSNMTTSNAIRTLSNFASERIIAIDGRKIKIIDEEKLEKISRIG